MISQQDKEIVFNKLQFAGLENATRYNCGKLIRVLHMLYRNEPRKQAYMIRLVCQKDPYIAAMAVAQMRMKAEAQKVLEDYLTEWQDDDNWKRVTHLAVYFRLREKEKFQYYLRLYAGREWDLKWMQRLADVISDISDLLLFLNWASEVEEIGDRILKYFLKHYDFKQQDIKTGGQELTALLEKFTLQKRFICCFSLVGEIGEDVYYQLTGMSYDEFTVLLDQWMDMWYAVLEQEGKDTNQSNSGIELNYCKAAFLQEKENTFAKFRTRNRRYLPKNISSMYLSFLYEYQLSEELSDSTVEEWRELNHHPVGNGLPAKRELVEQIKSCINICILQQRDALELLELVRPINMFDNTSSYMQHRSRVNFSVLQIQEGRDILLYYLSNEKNVRYILSIYFNSYLRVQVDFVYFLRNLWRQGFCEEDINAVLSEIYVYGYVKYMDEMGTVVNFLNVRASRGLPYHMDSNGTDSQSIRKNSSVQFNLCMCDGRVEIGNLHVLLDPKHEDKTEQAYTEADTEADTEQTRINETLYRYRILGKRPGNAEMTCKALKKIPFEIYEDKEEVISQIVEQFKEAIYIRRHNPAGIVELIKHLSLHNVYCARKDPIASMDLVSLFCYNRPIRPQIIELAETIIQSEDTLSDCYFIFINTFLKQYIRIRRFYLMCQEKNLNLVLDDFSYTLLSVGTFMRDEDNRIRYIPRDVSGRTKIYCEVPDECVDNDKMYVAKLLIKHENQQLDIVFLSYRDIKQNE